MESIFEYTNYREFLGDFYEHAKKTKPQFSYRYFANKAGLASAMHLKLVINGKRNLSYKSVKNFTKGLDLKKKESEYFENLVYYNQAKKDKDKLQYLETLTKIKTKKKQKHPGSVIQSSLFEKWYYPLVYELVSCKDFEANASWISKRLGNLISSKEAKEAFLALKEAELISIDANKKYKQNYYSIKTDDEVENLLLRQYHKKMIELSLNKIHNPIEKREYGLVTVATSKDKFLKLKAKIKEFIEETNEELTCDDEKEKELVQLNIQLFSFANTGTKQASKLSDAKLDN